MRGLELSSHFDSSLIEALSEWQSIVLNSVKESHLPSAVQEIKRHSSLLETLTGLSQC